MKNETWGREYRCGCRDMVEEEVGADTVCERHGEPVVVVGYLTNEETAEELRERLRGGQ